MAELTFMTRQIETYTAKAFEALTAGTLIYLALCLGMAAIMNQVERHFRILGLIVRAGIQSVPRGQVEAATAGGLSYGQTMVHVVLPQAIRNMIPSLVTQFIVLFKDTSLASIIRMMDLTKAAQTVSQREIRPFEMYLFIAAVYWICTYSMSHFSYPLPILAQRTKVRLTKSPPSPPLAKGGDGGICMNADVIVRPYVNGIALKR